MRHQREEDYLSGNLTAMIDVVFQLIIFFVCTVNMQDKAIDERIKLAMAPNGKVDNRKNPYEVKIDISDKGVISIARFPMNTKLLTTILNKARADAHGVEVPVLIRADGRVKHETVRRVMDACTDAKIWKIKFTALKEKA
ncbi:MAG: biopolymer transporter ExbD [bacterium]